MRNWRITHKYLLKIKFKNDDIKYKMASAPQLRHFPYKMILAWKFELSRGIKMKLPRELYNYLCYELYNYEKNKKELLLLREEIIESSPVTFEGNIKNNRISNPTEKKFMRLSSSASIIALERSINAANDAMKILREEHRHLFREVFTKGRKDYIELAAEMCIGERTMKRYKGELIQTFGVCLGVIK